MLLSVVYVVALCRLKVVLEIGVHISDVKVYPWEDDGGFHNYCTGVRKGDIAIEPIGRR